MTWCSVDAEDAQAIGARARMIRRRRGLSLEVAAGLAGITKGYLSMLELGQRGFNRRGACADGRIGRPDPAFTALVQSYIVAGDVANRLAGNVDLSVSASGRGYDMACRHGDAGLTGFARWCWALQLMWLTARGRASRVLTAGIDELGPSARLRDEDTPPAEILGMMYLARAQRRRGTSRMTTRTRIWPRPRGSRRGSGNATGCACTSALPTSPCGGWR